jgi:hypothetical protein
MAASRTALVVPAVTIASSTDTVEGIAEAYTGSPARALELVVENPRDIKLVKELPTFVKMEVDERLMLPPSWTGDTELAWHEVKALETPVRLARHYTGSGARWPELIIANPGKATMLVRVGWLRLYGGLHLDIPQSWRRGGVR